MSSKAKILLLAVFTFLIMLFVAFTLRENFKKPRAVKASDFAVRKIGFWKSYGAPVLEEKIFAAPPELLEYLLWDNQAHHWPNRPEASALTAERKALLQNVLKGLPENVKAAMRTKLAGVFLVKDLGGTGYTENILDENGAPVAGFIVLDELVLTKKANEWATWKERTPFTHPGDLRLTIENADGDTVENAVQYIVLHELGHVISIGTDLHPRQDTQGGEEADPARYRFSRLSWRLAGEDFAVLPPDEFPTRREVAFYKGGAELDPEKVYAQLAKTSFPTLYGATNPFDDFAEGFASYIHVVMMKKPYRVEAGSVTFESCWGQARCAQKEAILRERLQRDAAAAPSHSETSRNETPI